MQSNYEKIIKKPKRHKTGDRPRNHKSASRSRREQREVKRSGGGI